MISWILPIINILTKAKPAKAWAMLPTQNKSAIRGERVGIKKEFFGMGCLKIFFSKGQKPQQGGGGLYNALMH